jgi:hypothetical protein
MHDYYNIAIDYIHVIFSVAAARMSIAAITEFVRGRLTPDIIDLEGLIECIPEKARAGCIFIRVVCALERIAADYNTVHTIRFNTSEPYIATTNWADNTLGMVHRVLDAFSSVRAVSLQGQGLQHVTAETLADLAERLHVLDVRHTAAASVYRRDITTVFTTRGLLHRLVRS